MMKSQSYVFDKVMNDILNWMLWHATQTVPLHIWNFCC